MPLRRSRLPVVPVLAAALGLGACCSSGVGEQLREELVVTRGSKVGMGGAIAMPPFTDPEVVRQLRDGTSKARILALVGPPWRELPAAEGTLWVWDTEVFDRHVLLALRVVDDVQRGEAVAEWRTIPDFMLHDDWLEPGIDVEHVVDLLGSPSRWEIRADQTCMVWEAQVQLERAQSSWRYSPETYHHSLRLSICDDRLRSVAPIMSRKLDGWPSSAAQRAAGVESASRDN